ncbi:hypothetical protein Ssi03_50980 [Sphaerisporangium siamense]|uniref:Energy-converting hydrogenase Eha subunit F n=1 Tax=Sphaerisporangium siamense TaxID=795645 RepID=A0A7W7DB88_9ACTN|nr:hypothetical protein [Sphaerisporangium siamense]MBB4702198.1 energy-converting hydrogenase Eha subunit F [Sphaerisporangium siamense]GII87108.1 hypothetical protein Ssi03_50980 [Sphaerisporangium siamense]
MAENSGLDLLGMVAALTDPANAHMPTLICLAAGAVLIVGCAVALVLHRDQQVRRRPPLEDLADPPHNPSIDGTFDYIRRPR